jgi:MFS superfamily sulfate permease-like transporter
VGFGSLLLLIILRRLKMRFPKFLLLKMIPGVLIVVGVSMLLAWIFDFADQGVPMVSEVPK